MLEENCVKETISGIILQKALEVAEFSERVSVNVEGKLGVVMSAPNVVEDGPSDPGEAYPPLFDMLRSHLITIDRSLANIEKCIVRTEL